MRLSFGFVTRLRYPDKCIVDIMIQVYIERNNLQLELIRYRKKDDLFTFTFTKRRIQCNIAHRMHIRKFRTQTSNGFRGLKLFTLPSVSDSLA